MKKLNLRKTFITFICALFAVLLIQSWLIYTKTSHIIDQSIRFSESDVLILNKAHQLKLSVVEVQQWLTDISATRGKDGLMMVLMKRKIMRNFLYH